MHTSSAKSTSSESSLSSQSSQSSQSSDIGGPGRFKFSIACHKKRWEADTSVAQALDYLNDKTLQDAESRARARDALAQAVKALSNARVHEQKNIDQLNKRHTNSDELNSAIAEFTKSSGKLTNAAITGVNRSNKNLSKRGTGCGFKTANLFSLAINWGMGIVFFRVVSQEVIKLIDRQIAERRLREQARGPPNSKNSSCIPAVPPCSVPFYPAIATAAAATGGDIFRKDYLTAPIAPRLAGQFCHAFEDATGTSGSPPLVVDVSSTCQQCQERIQSSQTSRLGILSCRAPGHFAHFFSHYNFIN